MGRKMDRLTGSGLILWNQTQMCTARCFWGETAAAVGIYMKYFVMVTEDRHSILIKGKDTEKWRQTERKCYQFITSTGGL